MAMTMEAGARRPGRPAGGLSLRPVRTKVFQVALSEGEHARLIEKARESGAESLASYVRLATLGVGAPAGRPS